MRRSTLKLGSVCIRCIKAATNFKVPLLDGEHVTEDTGTGFEHTAQHGARTSKYSSRLCGI